jgi:hypothetical protein
MLVGTPLRSPRTNRDRAVRRRASRVGQSEDPRVLALFEERLTKP